MDKFTADQTVISAAENFCISETMAGREPVFEMLVVGAYSTFRQRRLFDAAMTAWMTRDAPQHAECHRQAKEAIKRFRSEAA